MPPRKKAAASTKKSVPKKTKSKKGEDEEETIDASSTIEQQTVNEDEKFIKFFLEQEKKKPTDTIIFIKRKGSGNKSKTKNKDNTEEDIFYSVHGKDALFIDKHYFKCNTFKCNGNFDYFGDGQRKFKGIPYLTIKPSLYVQYSKGLLMDKKVRVEVWEKKGTNYECVQSGSPGNIQAFEDIFLSTDIMTSVVASVSIKKTKDERLVGLVYCDTTLRTIGFCSFTDSDQFANLDAALIQIEAREVLIHLDNSPDSLKIRDVISRSGILLTERKKSHYVEKDIDSSMRTLVPGEIVNVEFKEDIIRGATQCLIDYLDLLSDFNNHSYYRTISFRINTKMKLDSACVLALNILPNPNDRIKSDSLYGLLNKCVTKTGSRKLREWIRQPLLDVDEIEQRLDMVEIMVNDYEFRESLLDRLKLIPDLDRLCNKLQRKKATCEDLFRLYTCSKTVETIKELMANCQYEKAFSAVYQSFIEHFSKTIEDLNQFSELVTAGLDMPGTEKNEFRINPELDTELQQIKLSMEDLLRQLDEETERIEGDLELEEGVLSRDDTITGSCFILPSKHSKLVTSNKEYTELAGGRQGIVRFITKTLKKLSEEYVDVTSQYEAKAATVMSQIQSAAASFEPLFSELRDTLSQLDIFASFANVAVNAKIPYVRPIIKPMQDEEEEIILKKCRHPCVETQDAVQFQENDCVLNRASNQFLLITGPNMGGKSTYIRQVALNILMAQIGCYIPCEEGSVVTVRDAILARIGASDSQLRGISTFMSEMLETSSILATATRHSLIIVDELGRGTSTYDGFGLAYSIIEHIMEQKHSFTLFATHFHELRVLVEQHSQIHNYCMQSVIKDKKCIMTYKIQDDSVVDNSFGVHVAELAQFPQEVIEVAHKKAKEITEIMENNGVEEVLQEPSKKKVKLSEEAKINTHQVLCQIYNTNFEQKSIEDILNIFSNIFTQ
ncbi:hypothetical protein ABK040_011676 [Willaertia magna]